MAKLRQSAGAFTFQCPGCGDSHTVNTDRARGATWTWNGSLDKPTFTPSLLVRSGHYAPSHKKGDPCWCTYAREHPERPSPFTCYVCHSYVTDGRIKFLNDCTHDKRGQMLDLAEVA